MRKSTYLALAIAALIATSVHAEVPAELYREWDKLNDICFAKDLDDPEGVKACRKRQEVLEQIREYRAYDGNRPKRGG